MYFSTLNLSSNIFERKRHEPKGYFEHYGVSTEKFRETRMVMMMTERERERGDGGRKNLFLVHLIGNEMCIVFFSFLVIYVMVPKEVCVKMVMAEKCTQGTHISSTCLKWRTAERERESSKDLMRGNE